ncbi:MAG: SoxR reducing system RseC family protein [Gammaproteobacteria bacterium]|nr:SoxR reducing system RseC family protein [Gammaproteobacteria bacterium]
MIEAEARVTGIDREYAEVVTLRQSACGSCAASKGCGTSLIAAWFPQRELRFRLRNDIGAEAGDRVVLGLDEGSLQRGSLLLYAVPLGGLLGGAIAGDRLLPAIGLSAELGAIVGGLLGLIGALRFVSNRSASTLDDGAAGVRLLRKQATPGALYIELQASRTEQLQGNE